MNREPPESPAPAEISPRWWLRLGHDMRAPVAPMRMALEILRNGHGTADERDEALRMLDRQVDRLLATIEDMSDLARINAGTFVANLANCDLNLALDIVQGKNALSKCLQEKQQSLRCIASETMLLAEHDSRRLAELVAYLIAKTSRYAAEGAELTLQVEPAPEPGRVGFRIGGASGSLQRDPEFGYVTGSSPIDANELEAKPIVMREIVRLNDLRVSYADDGAVMVSLRASS